MITLCNGKYEARRDPHQWILTEFYEGKDRKTGNPKRQSRETYHASLSQVCRLIVDREAGRCEGLEELLAMLANAAEVFTAKAMEEA